MRNNIENHELFKYTISNKEILKYIQNFRWTTKDRTEIKVEDMDLNHVVNSINVVLTRICVNFKIYYEIHNTIKNSYGDDLYEVIDNKLEVTEHANAFSKLTNLYILFAEYFNKKHQIGHLDRYGIFYDEVYDNVTIDSIIYTDSIDEKIYEKFLDKTSDFYKNIMEMKYTLNMYIPELILTIDNTSKNVTMEFYVKKLLTLFILLLSPNSIYNIVLYSFCYLHNSWNCNVIQANTKLELF